MTKVRPNWIRHGQPRHPRRVGTDLRCAGTRHGPAARWVWQLDNRMILAAVKRHHAREIRSAQRDLERLTRVAAVELVTEARMLLMERP
jgi:hypothetical protein